jgi:Ca-activated chloride channel homolog
MAKSHNNSNRIILIALGTLIFLITSFIIFVIILVSVFLGESENGNSPFTKSEIDGVELQIVSGSENETLEPLIEEFNEETGAKVEMNYLGSVDILLKLNRQETGEIDAVWPASSLVLNLTDNSNLKHNQSILRSPVILGLKKERAESLGWTDDNSIKVEELLTALSQNEFKMAMTNATQSNSGLSGYLAFLQAFAETEDVLTVQDLEKTAVQDQTRALLNLVNRSSGSSGWLKDLFLEEYDTLDAMINYEALVIETNQELVKQGKEPLQAIYLEDGMVVADSPLAYLDKGEDKKEEAFLKLQEFLLSERVSNDLLSKGRRTSLGLNVDVNQNNLSSVFKSEWGIKSEIPFVTLRYPTKEVIEEMLNLYQISLRKPSLTVYVIDVSGSMQGNGLNNLKKAMQTIANQQSAKQYFLQASPRDISIVIPFNNEVMEPRRFEGNEEQTIRDFNLTITGLQAGGGTDMYSPLLEAFEIIEEEEGITEYFPAVILMTDGRSANEEALDQLSSNQDIPVFPIMFGQAEEGQLDKIVEVTSGRVFDGREDLVEAFRKAKGYN